MALRACDWTGGVTGGCIKVWNLGILESWKLTVDEVVGDYTA